jgi:hypothetical protein
MKGREWKNSPPNEQIKELLHGKYYFISAKSPRIVFSSFISLCFCFFTFFYALLISNWNSKIIW